MRQAVLLSKRALRVPSAKKSQHIDMAEEISKSLENLSTKGNAKTTESGQKGVYTPPHARRSNQSFDRFFGC